MKKLVIISILFLLSCRGSYELQARVTWFEVVGIETKERCGIENQLTVILVSDMRVRYYINVPIADSNIYSIGKSFYGIIGR